MTRPRLLINAFVCVSAGHVKPGLWPYDLPGNDLLAFDRLETWLELARTLERGRFDTLFIGDVLGLYAPFGGSHDVYIEDADRFPMLDSLALTAALIPVTSDLGLVLTSSVIQDHPYSLARRLGTLDHFSGGRIGWNIVTSSTENAHRNYGARTIIPHDERYERAEEHVEVVLKLLEASWEEDAVVRDRRRRVFADPRKVHTIDHEGENYAVEGPLIVHPSPQRTPVLFQAGSSPRGTDFAAKYAEGAFLLNSLDGVEPVVTRLAERAAAHGRRPGDVKPIAGVTIVIGSSEAEAREKLALYESHVNRDALAAEAGGNIGVDLSQIGWDDPIDYSQAQGGIGKIMAEAKKYPDGKITKRQYLDAITGKTTIVGSPEQVADELERWQDAGIAGVNIMNYVIPGTYTDVVDHLIPVLQQRGLAQREYEEGTLREKLGFGGPHLNERHPGSSYRDSVRSES